MINRLNALFASLHPEETEASGAPEWLVVGLGNPGAEYDKTRHNAGFDALDVLAQKTKTAITRNKFKALIGTCTIADKRVLLMKPQTFMNLSGEAVAAAAQFYQIPMTHVLVLFDDISLAVGKLRIRRKGSAGGHNGIKDIIAKGVSADFPRVKIGVGAKPHPDYDLAAWVLGHFSKEDRPVFEQALTHAADAVEELLQNGVDSAMNRFNA